MKRKRATLENDPPRDSRMRELPRKMDGSEGWHWLKSPGLALPSRKSFAIFWVSSPNALLNSGGLGAGPQNRMVSRGRTIMNSRDHWGLGAKAAQPPEPPSGFNYTTHKCNGTGGRAGSKRRRAIGKNCGKFTLIGKVEGRFKHLRFRCKSYQC